MLRHSHLRVALERTRKTLRIPRSPVADAWRNFLDHLLCNLAFVSVGILLTMAQLYHSGYISFLISVPPLSLGMSLSQELPSVLTTSRPLDMVFLSGFLVVSASMLMPALFKPHLSPGQSRFFCPVPSPYQGTLFQRFSDMRETSSALAELSVSRIPLPADTSNTSTRDLSARSIKSSPGNRASRMKKITFFHLPWNNPQTPNLPLLTAHAHAASSTREALCLLL